MIVWWAFMLPLFAIAGRADDPRERVAAILEKVQPYDLASRDEAEEALVKGGSALVPAIRVSLSGSEETRKEALGAALVRLTWKEDPRKTVSEWLTKRAGEPGGRVLTPRLLVSGELFDLFPDELYYSVHFRQYPVATLPPAGFSQQNVAAYSKGGTVRLFTKVEELKEHFQKALGAATNPNQAAAAWLRLTQEFSQDGFFRFTIPADQIKSAWQENGALVVKGKALVTPKGGDSGEIAATLTFAGPQNGPKRLVRISETRDVKAGVRPICQSTKLLDPDPIVRRMAEQDLLVMGRAAWPYVMEQRQKALPDLRKEIDRVWKRITDEKR
jgi:hypothetical protein